MSYVRFDDQHENGRLTELCARLSGEVRMQLGEPFSVFQDRNDISWGQQWKERIEGTIDATTFLIPIITPGFFKSKACREEVDRFLRREKALERGDLILPIYYVTCATLSDETLLDRDIIAQTIATRQYADWRDLRFEPLTTPSVGKTLAVLAGQIVRALEQVRPEPAPSSAAALAKSADDEKIEIYKDDASQEYTAIGPAGYSVKPKMEPKIIVVDALHRGDYSKIADALQVAESGYRILIRPGLYREGIIIDKAVELIGDGDPGDVVIEATGKDVILFRANMGRAVNLTIRQAGEGEWYGVDIEQGRLDLEACDITSRSLACVAIHGGADPRLRRNRIHDGQQSGVHVFDNGLGTLEDNEIVGNRLAGVSVKTGGNPTFRRNRIYDGNSSGVFVFENGVGVFEDNEIFGNAVAGVSIAEGGNPILRRNRIHDGKQAGIHVYENGLGTIEDNEIFANTLAGVIVKTGGNPTLRRNRIHDGKKSGVFIHDNGLGVFEDNEIRGNAGCGVAIESGGDPKIRRNVISKNAHEAIWVYEGGRGDIQENDLRGNVRGAFDISEACRDAVKTARNQV
jgi:F-box protein 11